NYGPADHDQTHILTANYIWDIPSLGSRLDNRFAKALLDNWQLSGTTSFVTGTPKGMTLGFSGSTNPFNFPAGQPCPAGTARFSTTQCQPITDFTGGEVNARPFALCNPNHQVKDAADGTPVLADANCFARPTERGQIGNTSRNLIRKPGVINFDLALF